MPLAVSKEISPEYKKVMEEMSSKGASEKKAFGPWANAIKTFVKSRSIGGHLMNAGRRAGSFAAVHPLGAAAGVGFGTAYAANKIQDRSNRKFMANMGMRYV